MPAATAESGDTPRRRRPFQWTLRGFLLVVAVLSLGMWYWWQRPFEVEVVIRNPASSPPPAHLDSSMVEDPFFSITGAHSPDPFGPGSKEYYRRELRTIRRSGWRGVVRHGPSRAFNRAGQKIFEETWRAGQRHGPYKMWNDKGQLIVRGHYLDGVQHGTWVEYSAKGPSRGKKWIETSYEGGRVVRKAYYRHLGGRVKTSTADYRDDEITALDGEPVDEWTRRFLDSPMWVRGCFTRPTELQYDEASFADVVDLFQRELELYDISFGVDRRALAAGGCDVEQRFSDQYSGMSLRLALLVFLRQCDLVCDYRYERVVITTASDARGWTDRTGVSELRPPADSPWAQVLNQETGAESTRIEDWAADFKDRRDVAVKLDPRISRQPGASVARIHSAPQPQRHWLWILLGREGLTCKLDGDTLVTTPLED